MGDPAVLVEDESCRLDMRPALMRAGVAADGVRRRIWIQPVEHPKRQPQPFDCAPRFLFAIGRECYDLCIQRVELRFVLLEVSQLLTTVASPVSAVEQEHGGAATQFVRNAKRAAVRRSPLKLGEALPDTKSFHDCRGKDMYGAGRLGLPDWRLIRPRRRSRP
jgi:hypothetical protein